MSIVTEVIVFAEIKKADLLFPNINGTVYCFFSMLNTLCAVFWDRRLVFLYWEAVIIIVLTKFHFHPVYPRIIVIFSDPIL